MFKMASSKSLRKGQFPTSCKLCEVEARLSWKCMDCDILMCNRCKERIHPNIRNAGNHKVIDIKDIGKTTEEVYFYNIQCKEHKEEMCFMFCKSCDQLVCPQCIAKIHKAHGLVEISEGYQIKVQRLKDRQNEMKIKTDKLVKSKIKEIKKAENAKYTEAKKKIQAHNILLKKEVDQYSEHLFKELDRKWQTLLNSIEEDESKVTTLGKNNMVRNMEDVIQSGDVEKIFETRNKLDTCLEEAEQLEYNYTSMPSFIPGKISQSNVGSLQDTSTDITLQVIKEYTTDISQVYHTSPCVDSLWISNQNIVQKVKPEVNDLKVISSFNFEMRGMAVTPSNDLLVAPLDKSVLKKINRITNKLTDTNYSVAPLCLTAVHVSSDGKVVVGAKDIGDVFPVTGRRVVISMDKEGRHRTVYEHDRNNQRIFSFPISITSTHSGNICVVDRISNAHTGRVVVLGQEGGILNIYTGHPDINTKHKPFTPVSVATTPSDNTIVPDIDTHTLHILNSVGHLMTYINTIDKGIQYPYSIAFTTKGNMCIGCTRAKGSTDNKAKLYEVKILD